MPVSLLRHVPAGLLRPLRRPHRLRAQYHVHAGEHGGRGVGPADERRPGLRRLLGVPKVLHELQRRDRLRQAADAAKHALQGQGRQRVRAEHQRRAGSAGFQGDLLGARLRLVRRPVGRLPLLFRAVPVGADRPDRPHRRVPARLRASLLQQAGRLLLCRGAQPLGPHLREARRALRRRKRGGGGRLGGRWLGPRHPPRRPLLPQALFPGHRAPGLPHPWHASRLAAHLALRLAVGLLLGSGEVPIDGEASAEEREPRQASGGVWAVRLPPLPQRLHLRPGHLRVEV
mmetsp:Transcript_10336/g.30658  ORF Transcript_10336/g.30658 Transcript_10336/m.30658 type:complete len:287 (+) Transcript_10336:866-1726(+)